MHRHLLSSALAAALLMLTACGGGGDDSDDSDTAKVTTGAEVSFPACTTSQPSCL